MFNPKQSSAPSNDRKLPLLPGFTFDNKFAKEKHHKQQLFAYKNGIPVVSDYDASVEVEDLHTETEKLAEMLKSTNDVYKNNTTTDNNQNWLSLDKKVLRFYAYFKEGVHESAIEQSRVRKCVIFYYLEDDTMHIGEPKQDNSGIPQGTLVKRHRIPRANSSSGLFYTIDDLNVGKEITVYGKTFRIVDCDPFTREFFGGIGVEVPEPEDYPGDQHTDRREEIKKSMNPYKTLNPMDQDLKKYMEYSFKGKRTNPSKQEKIAVQKFLALDRQVLRFFCSWDDSEKLYGDKRFFIIEFYLSDDTIKISETFPANSGYDPFCVFLKKQKVPRKKSSPSEPTTYYEETDLGIGKTINIFSKEFLMYDCDEFTKQFYAEKYGISDMTPIEVKNAPKTEVVFEAPPYNGFGDEEDSLGSWKYLVIKPPKKDVLKYLNNDHKLFRFSAVMVSENPEDKGRKFVFSYYLNDDTISIFEPVQRNSGIIGGKFLQRGKVKNPTTGEYYKSTDVFVGAQLTVFSHVFLLTGTDQFTVNFMEQDPNSFPKANFDFIINRLREETQNTNSEQKIREVFNNADTDKSGFICMDELKNLFVHLDVPLDEHELITILRQFDANEDGRIEYSEFCNALFSGNSSSGSKQVEKKQESQRKTLPKDSAEFNVAFKSFTEKISTRKLLVQDAFKVQADKSSDGLLGEKEFQQAVQVQLKLALSDDQVKALADNFFPETKKRLTLLELMKIISGTSTWSYLKTK